MWGVRGFPTGYQMKIMIEIKLYATLQSYAPADAARYAIEAGTSVETIVETLHIPKEAIKLLFCNGVKCGMGAIPKDGDRIGLFPPVGGG
jgi:molybdopterin synthase sulfur carrier subunit